MGAYDPERFSFVPDKTAIAVYLGNAAEKRDRIRAKAAPVGDPEGLRGLTRSHQECTRTTNSTGRAASVVEASVCAGYCCWASCTAWTTAASAMQASLLVVRTCISFTSCPGGGLGGCGLLSLLSVTFVSSRRILRVCGTYAKSPRMYADHDIPLWGIDLFHILLRNLISRIADSLGNPCVRYDGPVVIGYGRHPKIYDDLIFPVVVPFTVSHPRLLSPHPGAGYPLSMAHRDVLAA
jgi:hypothetical protein